MRLKFKMWKAKSRDRGYYTEFTDGRGVSTQSWWSSPQMSIDHAGPEYLINRHPNVRNARHNSFFKERYKQEMVRIKDEEGETQPC